MKGLSNYVKSFEEISKEYEFSHLILENRTSYYNKLVAKDFSVPSAGGYYNYITLQEARELRQKLKLEIERKYTFELTAAFEAKLVYYFRNILKRKSSFYKTYKREVSSLVRKGMAHLMYQHILLVCKEEIQPTNNIVYSNFKNLIEYRNWLAHGRGWELENHLEKFDFEYSFLTIEKVIELLPNFPQNLK
jgi:hypothetical protein